MIAGDRQTEEWLRGVLQMSPAKSQAQRRFIFARFGKAWAKRHHFANKGKLPKRARKKR